MTRSFHKEPHNYGQSHSGGYHWQPRLFPGCDHEIKKLPFTNDPANRYRINSIELCELLTAARCQLDIEAEIIRRERDEKYQLELQLGKAEKLISHLNYYTAQMEAATVRAYWVDKERKG